jgi:hypothetical protein
MIMQGVFESHLTVEVRFVVYAMKTSLPVIPRGMA